MFLLSGISTGGIVGIVLGILILILLVGIIIFFIFSGGINLPGKSKAPLDIGSVGFDNAVYSAGSGSVQVKEKDPTSVA